jgi:hypothetical protein
MAPRTAARAASQALKAFVGTLPGLLTSAAALITAIAGAFYGGTRLADHPQVQPTVFITVTAQPSPAPATTGATAPTPTSATSPAAETITYKVIGSPADVGYGPSGSDIAGNSPMTITAKLGNAGYYPVGAQLRNSGGNFRLLEFTGEGG